MNRNVERILVACLLSFIGTLIAKQLGFYWWGGLIFGFGTGYLGYDFRAVLAAIPVAFSKACDGVTGPWITKEQISRFFRFSFYTFGGNTSIAFTFVGIILGLLHLAGKIPGTPLEVFQATSFISAGFAIVWSLMGFMTHEMRSDNIDAHIEEMRLGVKFFHPLSLFCYTIPRFIIPAMLWLAKAIEVTCEFGCKFVGYLFTSIHSTPRLLFGIDVAIGVAIGYYTGNALIGGLAGGAWWLLDWHLISVKWMKLQPTE